MTREELARKIAEELRENGFHNYCDSYNFDNELKSIKALILPLLPEGAESSEPDIPTELPTEAQVAAWIMIHKGWSNEMVGKFLEHYGCSEPAESSPVKEEGTPHVHEWVEKHRADMRGENGYMLETFDGTFITRQVPSVYLSCKCGDDLIRPIGGIPPQEGSDASDTRTNSYGRTATPASGEVNNTPLARRIAAVLWKEGFHEHCQAGDSEKATSEIASMAAIVEEELGQCGYVSDPLANCELNNLRRSLQSMREALQNIKAMDSPTDRFLVREIRKIVNAALSAPEGKHD